MIPHLYRGVASGSITGFQNFLKDSLSILKACKESNESLPLLFYILSCLAAGTAYSGLLILTRCMKKYDATFSSSMFIGSFIITASIMADIHYHTFSNLVGLVNYIMYPLGLGILMVGLYLNVQDTSEPEFAGRDSDPGGIQFETISSSQPVVVSSTFNQCTLCTQFINTCEVSQLFFFHFEENATCVVYRCR